MPGEEPLRKFSELTMGLRVGFKGDVPLVQVSASGVRRCACYYRAGKEATATVGGISRVRPKNMLSTGMDKRPAFSDVPSSRRANMAAIKGKSTKPEMAIRQALHAMGYRYRLHAKELPGRPDLVFPGRKMVIEVRGCFWHRHDDPTCKNAVLPRLRAEWWRAKLDRNVQRDEMNVAALEGAGWTVLVVWECEVRKDVTAVCSGLARALGPAGRAGGSPGAG